jgi:uncharacterized protein (DUF58 family)
MLTARGWWFAIVVLALLALALFREQPVVLVLALTLLLWFAWEALLFAIRVRLVVRDLRVRRELRDERGPVDNLWAGRTFRVRAELHLPGPLDLPYLRLADRVPLEVTWVAGDTQRDGAVTADKPLGCTYTIRCGASGRVRFEGLAVQLADLQGLFYHRTFVHAVVEYPVLPALSDACGHAPTVKRHNLLPPPGLHRLRRPGSGSELLDLRDYLPGDPPKTIAWKPSARRDRLITKEFESEVPVRCTLLIDTSDSVRLGQPGHNALGRLVELAAGIAQANSGGRDLTGLCLVDEQRRTYIRPARGARHLVKLLRLLANVAALPPPTGPARVATLTPLAHAFALEVYPDLLRPDINHVPIWLPWLWPQPASTIRAPSLADRLNLWLPWWVLLFLTGSAVLLVVVLGVTLYGYYTLWHGVDFDEGSFWRLAYWCAVSVLIEIGLTILFVWQGVRHLFFPGRRRLYRQRKQLAALLAVQQHLAPGGLGILLEDDERFALALQRFLTMHHVPYPLPLYDPQGRYRFASPAKVEALAQALLRAIRKQHDNELFVVMADLLELADGLEPLLRAVKVALARHHQVVVVCPWPPQVPPPTASSAGAIDLPEADSPSPSTGAPALEATLWKATTFRLHGAFHDLRRRFARLGVPVVCALIGDPVRLVLDRIDRLRAQGRRR